VTTISSKIMPRAGADSRPAKPTAGRGGIGDGCSHPSHTENGEQRNHEKTGRLRDAIYFHTDSP